jgi:hypothetical protein
MGLDLVEFTKHLKIAWSSMEDEGEELRKQGKCGEVFGGCMSGCYGSWLSVCTEPLGHEGKHWRVTESKQTIPKNWI